MTLAVSGESSRNQKRSSRNVDLMKQEDSWQRHYDEIMQFMEQNHRYPSRHRLENHRMLNWIKYNKKQIAKGLFPTDRLERFNKLLDTAKQYHRQNQYV